MKRFKIPDVDKTLDLAILSKIDNLNKPKGSLGELEGLALQICKIQQTLSPTLFSPCHILFGADHGIEREGVSASPRSVSWQQMINFTQGGAGVNMFCRQHKFDLYIIDVGIDYDLSAYPAIIDRKISFGTKNFLYEEAMNKKQFEQAINIGCDIVNLCKNKGANILSLGEMGIGNTSPASVWMSLLGNIPLRECVGKGSGLSIEKVEQKYQVLHNAITRFKGVNSDQTPLRIIQYFGGFEMVAAIGAMLKAAEEKMIIIIDGFIMSACLLAASKLYSEVLNYAIFGHCSDEYGHKQLLKLMQAKPLLNLNLRLGEGTGALCSYPIIESAVRMMNEMNNFQDAKIDKYF